MAPYEEEARKWEEEHGKKTKEADNLIVRHNDMEIQHICMKKERDEHEARSIHLND